MVHKVVTYVAASAWIALIITVLLLWFHIVTI
jgi:hypothetical protein